jgi:polygalacturonase
LKSRREFLRSSLRSAGVLLIAPGLAHGTSLSSSLRALPRALGEWPDAWAELPDILARMQPPVFPDRNFDLTTFGAVGDNLTDCTEAFQKAIAACNRAGGGRVVVREGEFRSGAIHLKSGVNLHLNAGATIRFVPDPKKYPRVFTRWEGVELMNFSPFIYAFEQQNIAVTGEGTIDGNADCEHWWPWKGRTNCGWKPGQPNQDSDRRLLFDMAERGVPVKERIFGESHYLRPQFIQPYRCQNVLIEGVTLLHSPMWQVHPVLCTNVTVRGLNISSTGPNTDGCDPESCTEVLIQDCSFNTGDDCIAIKSGRNADGRRVNVPSRNIVIQGCHMKDGHGGVTVGSEISGGVNHVFAENCRMDSADLDIALRIKNNAMRGGLLENIYARNLEVGQVAIAGLSIDFFYEEGEAGKFPPVVRNVEVRNLRTKKAKHALYLRGFKAAPIENVAIVDCDFDGVAEPDVIENVKGLSLQHVKENGNPVAHAG